jgi:hypothetical protein
MRYLLELYTAAGIVTLGPFTSLDEARTYADGLGAIRPLFPPTVPARDLVHGTRAEVLAKIDAQDTRPTKTTRQDRPGSTNRTPPAI